MNKNYIENELGRIRCTSKYVGDTKGLEICSDCSPDHWHIYNYYQSVLIPKTEINNVFKQLEDNCGLEKFWDTVKNNNLYSYSEHSNSYSNSGKTIS